MSGVRCQENSNPKTWNLATGTFPRAARGFTLIELLAVCMIIALIAGIVMANQGKFGGQVLLQNFAYDVALSLRQAQVYGISVQRFQRSGTTSFDAGYGVNIDLSVSNKRYALYADSYPSIPNGLYDSALNQDELKQNIDITRGYVISKLCVPAGTNADSCTAVSAVDIVFVRPEPDALISWRECSGSNCAISGGVPHACLPSRNAANCQASARIVLRSPRGDTMSVSVFNNGQIAVDQTIDNN